MNNEEIWKDIYYKYHENIYDYRGLYKVSNRGRIKSLHDGKERILKPNNKKNKYREICLQKDGKRKYILVHIIVANVFIPNVYNKPCIDHIIPVSNGGTDCVENLRWVTHSENMNNEITKEKISGENNHNYSKPVSEQRIKKQRETLGNKMKKENNPMWEKGKAIVQIKDEKIINIFYGGTQQASRETKINGGNIRNCCLFWSMNCDKESWYKLHKYKPIYRAGGFVWKYLSDVDYNTLKAYKLQNVID